MCSCTVSSYTPALNTFCGSRSVTTNCGTTVTMTGTLTCTSPQTCNATNMCSCTVSSYTPALNTFCGSRSVTTNCGTTVTRTGTLNCTSPQTCNATNMCSCTVSSYTPALNTFCGSRSVTTNCGTTVTMTGTLTCTSPQTCNATNMCSCTVSSYTPALNTFCGSRSVTTNCGTTVTRTGTLNCTLPQICAANGTCILNCTTRSYSACYGGDVYWYNSCGTRETIRYDCNSTQTCSSGVCVNNPPAGTQIIADHTIVDRYDDIPQCWIDEVKKMRLVIGGESHSAAYREGLNLLETAYSAYQVNVGGVPPEGETTSYLRASGVMWGDLWNSNQWVTSYGEEDWFTSATGIYNSIEITKKGITYCNTNDGWYIDAFGLGWCWDQGTNVNNYLNATQQYIDYCIANGYTTKILFTTGPVDSYAPADGYQKYLDYEATRNYVIADSSRVLFDYADILVYNDAGEEETALYNGNTYQVIHPDNMGGTYTGHIGSVGAIRLGKAQWWMMARIAGWDGVSTTCP